jgi:cell division septum initiation protein DivIVA
MNEALFKTTVMGGFNKSDVLAFIDRQDRQSKDREKELLARVDALSKDLKNEVMCTEQLKKRVAELESQLQEEKNKQEETIRKLQDENFTAAEIKADLSSEIEKREAEIDKVRLDSNELAHKLNEAEKKAADEEERADTIAKKLSLIDKTEDQIGRAVLEAQKTADNIVSSARNEADTLLQKTREETDRIMSVTKEHVSNIKADAQEKLDVLMLGVAEYEKRVSDARTGTADFFRAVDSMFTSLQNNADEILTDFTDIFKKDDAVETSAEISSEEDIPDETPTEFADAFTVDEGDNISEETGLPDDWDKTGSGAAPDDSASLKFDFRNSNSGDDFN